jgi:hypothetical protein
MKIVFKYLIVIIAFSFIGCKKYLDRVPEDAVPESVVFSTIPGAFNALTGAYNGIAGTYPNDVYATTLVTDEGTLPTENNTGRGVITYRWLFDAASGDVSAEWAGYYNSINRANRLLGNIDQIPVAPNTTDGALRDQYKGEALAIRAFAHWQVAKFYSAGFDPTSLSIPYMKVSVVSLPARQSFQEVVASVKADLALAKTLIPASFANNIRFTKNAVTAMQAQVALYEKDWDGAITYATELINAVPLATQAQFLQIWLDQSNVEVLFKIKRNIGETRIGDSYLDRSTGRIMYGPSKELINTYNQANDVRYAAYVRLLTATRIALNKYRGGDANNLNLADYKVFRVAEMYLIRAEAYAEKNNLIAGAADLNTLRAARITGNVPQVFATKADLITAVYTERFKELAFEGHRYTDLKRRSMDITRDAADATNALGAVLLTPSKREYIWPIPLTEIQANPNIVQNTGY